MVVNVEKLIIKDFDTNEQIISIPNVYYIANYKGLGLESFYFSVSKKKSEEIHNLFDGNEGTFYRLDFKVNHDPHKANYQLKEIESDEEQGIIKFAVTMGYQGA
jgi:hypothetical protein